MTTNKELLNWARKHKENIERRNKILGTIGVIVIAIFFLGYVNYLFISQLVNVSITIQLTFGFFGELSYAFIIMLAIFSLMLKIGYSKDSALAAAALAAVLALVAAALALAATLAALAATLVLAAALAAALAVVLSIGDGVKHW
ncbi:MAG: hypothetical protein ACREF7_03210 [Candidatus Saccharimonadales bacterium]